MPQKRYYIKVESGADDLEDLAHMLREIATHIDMGTMKSYHPTWEIETEEDNTENTMD